VLEFFDLSKAAGRTVRELFLGQRRRAVFAACFIGTPKHILLDEPLEGMDRSIQKEILEWIFRHTKAGAVVTVVSHSYEKFVELVSHALTVKNNRVISFKELPDTHEEKLALLEGLSKGKVQP